MIKGEVIISGDDPEDGIEANVKCVSCGSEFALKLRGFKKSYKKTVQNAVTRTKSKSSMIKKNHTRHSSFALHQRLADASTAARERR